MATITLRQRLRYSFDNTMSRGTPALIGWLAVASLLVVVVGGVLAWLLDPVTADGTHRGLQGALWQGVLHALDSGAIGGDTGHWWYVAIAFGVTVGGILVVAAFIGVLTTGLDARLTELRKGRSVVLERNHTVVLGWSDQIFTVISELVEANRSQRRPCIAILADRDKVEMEDEIRAKVPDTGNTRVVCRSGNPIDPDEIALVNTTSARSIIVLAGTDGNRDAHLIKSLLAVARSGESQASACHIVGSVADPRNLPVAMLAGGPNARLINATEIASRLIVQTCLQSGLSVVYTDLLDFGGDEIYFHHAPSLVGSSYGHALHAFRTSSVIGVVTAGGEVVLNPASEHRLRPDDQLITIATDDSTITVATPAPVLQHAITARPDPAPQRKRLLVLGWNRRAVGVLRQLDQYVPAGSEVRVVARAADAGPSLTRLAPVLRTIALEYIDADGSDRAVLDSLQVGSFHHVIVLCGDEVDIQEADSLTLITLLHLRDIEARTGGRFSIVSEMGDDRNRALAQVTQADDFIVSDKLLSLMTTQISENPHLAALFDRLFDATGAEFHLKEADRYVRLGEPITYQTVVEAAWRVGGRLPPRHGSRAGTEVRHRPEPGQGHGADPEPGRLRHRAQRAVSRCRVSAAAVRTSCPPVAARS